MGISREWIKNNIIDTFDIVCDGLNFNFSTHPQDPEMDMSHYVVDKPSISLVTRVEVDGTWYIKAIFLGATMSLEEIKDCARELVCNAVKRFRRKENG